MARDWSATPMIWVVAVVICPPLCFSGGCIVLDAMGRKPAAPTLLNRWALLAAIMPATAGSLLAVWVVRVLLLMCGL